MAWWDEDRYDRERYRVGSDNRWVEPEDYHRHGRGRAPEATNYRPYRGLREGRWDEDEWVRRGGHYTPDTSRRAGGLYEGGFGSWEPEGRRPEDRMRQRYAETGEFSTMGGRDTDYSGRYESYASGIEARTGPHRGRGPKGWTRSADAIRDDVAQRMADHGRLDASEIEISVDQGEVTLTGTVADRGQKRLAEAIADRVDGVRDVHNHLRLTRQEQREQTRGATGEEVRGR